MIFIKTLQKILKQDQAHQSMSWKGIYWNKKNKVIAVMKDELGGKIWKNLLDWEQKLIVT